MGNQFFSSKNKEYTYLEIIKYKKGCCCCSKENMY